MYQGVLQLTTRDFAIVFPYHLVIDTEMKVIHCGSGIIALCPDLVTAGIPLTEVASMIRPQIPFNFDAVRNFINAIFILSIHLPKLTHGNLPNKNETLRLKGNYGKFVNCLNI